MSKSVITSYTLIDFLSEADMLTFLSFAEESMQALADNLKANGMTKFYISRVLNKGDKFTIGNWLEYEDQ
jgi:predicted TPR repeat methyltransferase